MGGVTILSFDDDDVDVVYEGTELRLKKVLIEETIEKSCPDVIDHEVLETVGKQPTPSGEPWRTRDTLNSL